MVSILFLVPILIIILIVFLLAGIKINREGGGEEMIKNVYVYLVLFATLMMTIGGSVGAFMATADIIAPVTYYQSFEEFKRWSVDDKKDIEVEKQLSEKELRENYENMVLAEKERQMDRAKNNLIKSFGWIVIPLPVFIYFQRYLTRKKA